MKRRLIDKKRKQYINKTLKPIESYINSIKYLAGYFLFDCGKNSICHFTIKNLPHIKFGLFTINNSCELFAEHINWLDKFKPSSVCIGFKNILELQQFIKNCYNNYYETICPYYDISKEELHEIELTDLIIQDDIDNRNFLSISEWTKYSKKIEDYCYMLVNSGYINEIVLKKSECFNCVYSVWYYPTKMCPDKLINEIQNFLYENKGNSFQWRHNKFLHDKYYSTKKNPLKYKLITKNTKR